MIDTVMKWLFDSFSFAYSILEYFVDIFGLGPSLLFGIIVMFILTRMFFTLFDIPSGGLITRFLDSSRGSDNV